MVHCFSLRVTISEFLKISLALNIVLIRKSIMKTHQWFGLAILSGLGWGWFSSQSVLAFRFQNIEIEPQRVVAIAAPIGSNRKLAGGLTHQLLILEQISNSRPCWTESGNNPVSIDPLLLKFDFTGICGRSTDSNGYSLRVAGQDLGLQYSLRMVNQGNDLVLMGVPTRSSKASSVEIGRTRGVTSGFTKIIMNPGWRMTRRVFEGKAVGHIYLTNDQAIPGLIATVPTPNSVTPPSSPKPVSPKPTVPPSTSQSPSILPPPSTIRASKPPSNIPNQPTGKGPLREIEFSAVPVSTANSPVRPTNPSTPTTPPGVVPSGFKYRVVVPATNPIQQNQVRTIVPDAFRTQLNGQVVMQAGLFRDRQTADEVEKQLRQAQLPVQVLPLP